MTGVHLIDWALRGCLAALYLLAITSAVVFALFLTSRAMRWEDE